ncbi:MAG: coenzyme F420-0:L-glutamate ligase [Actinobacteria bacterium]|mgnify:FL=1|jgi:coenzyme F420-0:L-glutamate ligase/coenzyme F420-1:gamma-L-glutamate ligase|nr:coenzyme F420-0:L-glutamate ligase [Actinomycetota bacterium]MAB96435.1 coenzyme F420-0:L-glutamate ligase [Actinomycetota bacterium]|tara:strand:- start:4078 stop:4776 length:699 start_codon:yes stop_codon:yes gene_type:complete
MNEVTIIPISGLPEVSEGDSLANLTHDVLKKSGKEILDGDIFVVTQKIVSKSEGMSRNLDEHSFEDLLNSQVNRIVRKRGELVIAKTKHGFICANAGIDKSNIQKNTVLLLPEDPNKSAHSFRKKFENLTGKKIAVIISDTFGRAWRKGQVNFAIGSSGINPITSYIGKTDTFENELNATEIAVIDELASAAELVMEKTLNVPIAIIRGVNYEDSKKNASELIREDEEDFFL